MECKPAKELRSVVSQAESIRARNALLISNVATCSETIRCHTAGGTIDAISDEAFLRWASLRHGDSISNQLTTASASVMGVAIINSCQAPIEP